MSFESNSTSSECLCPNTLFPFMTHLPMDILFIIVICLVVCLLTFGFAATIFMCCRCIDKCMARYHLFHHRRAFLSTKTVHYHHQPIIRQNIPVVSSPFPVSSQSAPSSPQPTMSRSAGPRNVSFSDQNIAMIPLSSSGRRLNAEEINASLGLNLTPEQQSRLSSILQGSSSGIENPNFRPAVNVYDVPPVDVDSSFSDASDVTQIEVPLLHSAPKPTVVPSTPNTPRPNLRSKPPRRYPPKARSQPSQNIQQTDPAILPVR